MKIITFNRSSRRNQIGIVTDQGMLDVNAAAERYAIEVPVTVTQLLQNPDQGMAALNQVLVAAVDPIFYLKETEFTYGPCVPEPNKIICVGLNYRKHALETGKPLPTSPILFSKFNNALNAHQGEVRLPAVTEQTDYEAELCIVIGRKASAVSEAEALSYVFGYTAANDLSARDLQYRTAQWLLGKSLDGFAPIGPSLVTADEVGDANKLAIQCFVNGEQRQHSNTSDMIFNCSYLVSYISQHMTLEPGDLILTGTPDGVVMGYPPEKRVFLQHGDLVEIEIEKIGRLSNRIVQ